VITFWRGLSREARGGLLALAIVVSWLLAMYGVLSVSGHSGPSP
jgi:hypothetical protein